MSIPPPSPGDRQGLSRPVMVLLWIVGVLIVLVGVCLVVVRL